MGEQMKRLSLIGHKYYSMVSSTSKSNKENKNENINKKNESSSLSSNGEMVSIIYHEGSYSDGEHESDDDNDSIEGSIINSLLRDCLSSTDQSIMDIINNLDGSDNNKNRRSMKKQF